MNYCCFTKVSSSSLSPPPDERPNPSQNSVSGNMSSVDLSLMYDCIGNKVGDAIASAFMYTKFLASVPLSILVLHVGHRRWRRQRSFRTTSHVDILTYNAAVFQLIYALAVFLFLCSDYTGVSALMGVGFYLGGLSFLGEILIHILTCAERYLAVVHPVTYLGLRQPGGVRIRNVSIGCVWLLCCVSLGVTSQYVPGVPYIPYLILLAASSVVISFCSVSVLCVLMRRRPGAVGGDRERADKSKKKAFITITAILGVLLVFCLGMLAGVAVQHWNLLNYSDSCVVLMSTYWFSLPSSLVLPLLFMLRAKELPCCS